MDNRNFENKSMIQKIQTIIKTVDKTIEEYVLHFVDQIDELRDNEQSA